MSSNLLRRVARVGGILIAPCLYMAGRLTKSRFLLSAMRRADPLYVRGAEYCLYLEGRSGLAIAQFANAIELIAATGLNADLVIKEQFSKSHSQLLQDIACALVHSCKRGGYFIEVGVGDGVNISNTYFLETQFGWSGLLVEPNRSFHDRIRATRKAKLETRAVASTNGGQVEFEENVEAGEFSRLAKRGDRPFNKGSTKRYNVEVVTLDGLLEQHGAPNLIDYVSIDTEGSELDILRGFDLDRYRVGFFTIEHNFQPGTIEALKAILEPKGYRQILPEASRFDAWFLHSSINSTYIL